MSVVEQIGNFNETESSIFKGIMSGIRETHQKLYGDDFIPDVECFRKGVALTQLLAAK